MSNIMRAAILRNLKINFSFLSSDFYPAMSLFLFGYIFLSRLRFPRPFHRFPARVHDRKKMQLIND